MAATKKAEVVETGKQQVVSAVNNALIDGLVKQLDGKVKAGMSFPSDYNYANELFGAYLTLQETVDANKKPVLESCSKNSIVRSLMSMVNSGLSMVNGQCYPIAYGGKLSIQPSVYGNTCNAKRYGLKSISSMVIYEGDVFEYHIEDAEIVIDKHTQDFMNIDTNKITGAYAVATMNDGTKHIELMNISMIKRSWQQGYGYREGGNGTHQKFADQMAMKTVKNRCLKYIIRTHGSEAVDNAYTEFEEAETEDRVAMDVQHDIEVSNNAVEFNPEDVVEVESEVVEEQKVEEQDIDLPDFMKG